MAKKKVVKKVSKKSRSVGQLAQDILKVADDSLTAIHGIQKQLNRIEEEQKKQGQYYSKLFAEISDTLKELRSLPHSLNLLTNDLKARAQMTEERVARQVERLLNVLSISPAAEKPPTGDLPQLPLVTQDANNA